MQSELQKMRAGAWYSCLDDELEALRMVARRAVHQHNHMPPDARGAMGPLLRGLFASVGPEARIEASFHCSYGMNVTLGAQVFVNSGCVFLDSAPVHIGDRSMLGPGVQIYCADHHRDPVRRAAGEEIARPVTLGPDVWIGGGAILLPGVCVGAGAIVGAGSVVTRDVAPGAVVAGNPARPR